MAPAAAPGPAASLWPAQRLPKQLLGQQSPAPPCHQGVKTPHWDMESVPKSLLNSKVEHLRCSSTCRDRNASGAKLRVQGSPLSPNQCWPPSPTQCWQYHQPILATITHLTHWHPWRAIPLSVLATITYPTWDTILCSVLAAVTHPILANITHPVPQPPTFPMYPMGSPACVPSRPNQGNV